MLSIKYVAQTHWFRNVHFCFCRMTNMSHSRETAPDYELQDIVKHIFSKPPGDPKTVDLSFTPETASQFQTEQEREMMALEIFSQIAIMGAQRLFAKSSESFSLVHMSRDQY